VLRNCTAHSGRGRKLLREKFRRDVRSLESCFLAFRGTIAGQRCSRCWRAKSRQHVEKTNNFASRVIEVLQHACIVHSLPMEETALSSPIRNKESAQRVEGVGVISYAPEERLKREKKHDGSPRFYEDCSGMGLAGTLFRAFSGRRRKHRAQRRSPGNDRERRGHCGCAHRDDYKEMMLETERSSKGYEEIYKLTFRFREPALIFSPSYLERSTRRKNGR